MSMPPSVQLHNVDCMSYMASLPMGYFDLAIADPPYGIGRDWEKRDKDTKRKFGSLNYNNERISPQCLKEIIRVSKHWIIWGWNYFTDILPPSNNLIIWDKMSNCNQTFHYSKAEIAGTDIKIPCNLVSIPWDGYRMGEETGTKKIHPHQKPIALYRWLLHFYGRRAKTIFDPFAGSAALGVACQQLGKSYVGCEIERSFFDTAHRRLFGEKSAIVETQNFLPFPP